MQLLLRRFLFFLPAVWKKVNSKTSSVPRCAPCVLVYFRVCVCVGGLLNGNGKRLK